MRRFGLVLLMLAAGIAAAPAERDALVAALDDLCARGELERALQQAARARERYPRDLSIHARYQEIRRSLGHGAQVREEYRRRWRAAKSLESICLYARLLDGPAAVHEYRHALRLDPDYFWARYGLGVALLRMGRLDEARDNLERAQSLEPARPAPKIRLGQLHERAGRLDEALFCYRLAERVAPASPDPRFHQVFVLVALRRTDEARGVAERILGLPAPDAVVLGSLALGVIDASRGDRIAAVARFESAVEFTAGRYGPHALAILADTLTDLGRFEESQRAYERALAADPRHLRARLGLGYLLYRRGELERADGLFARAAESASGPDRAEPLYFRGVIAEERGRLARARAHYRAAVGADPATVGFRLAWAAVLERTGRLREALAAYLEAARLDEGNARALLQAGLIEIELGAGERALRHLHRAVERDPGLEDACLAAGTVCQDLLDRPEEARSWYLRYLEAGGTDERVREWLSVLESDASASRRD